MSAIIQTIDLSTITGTYTLQIPSQYTVTNVAWIDLLNQSPYNFTFQAGGLQVPVPAWDHYPIPIAQKSGLGPYWQPVGAVQFPATITPALLGNPGASLSTLLIVTIYPTGETPSSTSPRSLNYQNYVPNTVNTTGGQVATSIQNDNKAPGTSIIEATPSDAVSSTWSADNAGNLILRTDNLGTLTEMLRVTSGANPTILFMGLITMDAIGHIIMPNNVTLRWLDSSNNSQAVLVATSSDEVHLRATKAGGNVIIADSNDTAIATFNTTSGLSLASGGIHLPVGSFSRVNIFQQAVTTTLTAYNHGLGVVPDVVIMQLVGTTTTTATGKYDNTTMTTTTVKMISSVNATYVCTAIKM